MKLYLSSLSLPDEQAFNALFTGSSNKIGVIANAWTPYPEEKSRPYVDGINAKLKDLGFEVVAIDLLHYQGHQEELEKLLQGLEGIHLTGGNTFYLNWSIHLSGFHNIIQRLVNDGLVYSGESAGASVAGTTLHGIEKADDPKDAPEVIWEGLSLVDYGIVPHWGNEKYADILESCRDEMSPHATVKTINDDDCLVITS